MALNPMTTVLRTHTEERHETKRRDTRRRRDTGGGGETHGEEERHGRDTGERGETPGRGETQAVVERHGGRGGLCEDRGRDGNDVATSQGTPGASRSLKQQAGPSPGASGGAGPRDAPILRPPALGENPPLSSHTSQHVLICHSSHWTPTERAFLASQGPSRTQP